MIDTATGTQGYFREEETAQHLQNLLIRHGAMAVVRKAMERYMEEQGLSVAQVAAKAELSVATIRKLLQGGRISTKSFWKLMRLGEGYKKMLMDEMKAIGFKE